MPIIIPKDLPANQVLRREKIFVMDDDRAFHQDIRPLELAIVNLMPTKEKTETQLLRRISNTPLQINVDLIRTATHESKNTSQDHLDKFYKSLDEIKDKKYDGMIITGAPVEEVDFEDVDYWDEMVEIMEFARNNVFSTMFICWASQASLYHFYNIKKKKLDKKLFGIFECPILASSNLTRGLDDKIKVPHSRHTYCDLKDIDAIEDIRILSSSVEVGLNIAATRDERFIFVAGHGEYDIDTLDQEYKRDLDKGLKIDIPVNYYVDNKVEKGVHLSWNAHSNLFFANWINNVVYQETPFRLNELEPKSIYK